jgi:hypothetical protein
MNINEKMYARQFIAALTAAGAKPPKQVTDAWARCLSVAGAVDNLYARPEAISVAVAAAVERGDDPAADPAVQRALTAVSIANRGIGAEVDSIAFERFRQVCRDQADPVIKAWARPFDTAANTLASAAELIGDLTLESTTEILARGGTIAETWAGALSANNTITRIAAGWSAFVQFARLASVDARHRLLVLAAFDYPTFAATSATVTPWDATRAGLTLSLPTAEQYRQRITDVDEGRRLAELAARPTGMRSNWNGQAIPAASVLA